MPLCKTGLCPGIQSFRKTKVNEKIEGDKEPSPSSGVRHKKACTGQALSRPTVYRLVNAGFNFSIDQIFTG